VDIETVDGWTALHYASLNGYISIVELLHRKNANVSALDILKRNALHYCCKYNQLEVAQVLLRLGINYEAQDFENNKPLDIAKEKGY